MKTHSFGRRQVLAAVSMERAVSAVRAGFLSMAAGEFEMPERTVFDDGAYLLMAARHSPSNSLMTKTLTLNFDGRKPAILGTVVYTSLASTDQLVLDAGAVTALRTGAASGVATDLLAHADAATCTVIGAGDQAGYQVRGVHAVRPLSRLTIVDRVEERAELLGVALARDLPQTEIIVSTEVAKAISDVDIVCCATTSLVPLFEAADLPAEVHVNAIGAYRPAMHEIPAELLADSRTYIDDRHAALTESGEIIDAVAAGLIRESDLVELGVALRGTQSHGGRTVFKSVGVAMQDWAIADVLARNLNS